MEDIRILHVDKSRVAQRMLSRAVDMVAHCAGVQDMQEALQAIEKNENNFFILDYELPDGDGLTLARIIRQRPGRQTTPIILYTASLNNELAYQAMHAGINESIAKGIDPMALRERVVNLWEMPEIKQVRRELLQLTTFAWIADGKHHEYSPDIRTHVTGDSREECRQKMQEHLEREVRSKKDPSQYPADIHVLKHIIRLNEEPGTSRAA